MMRTRAGGMALLEVLMAMAVLALGLVTAAALQAKGTQAFASAGREGQALQLAQDMLERARAAGQVTAPEAAAWQAQVLERLGNSALGRVSHAGEELRLEVQWSEAGAVQVLKLQGKVLL